MPEPKQKILVIDDQLGTSKAQRVGFIDSLRLAPDSGIELDFCSGQTPERVNSVEIVLEKVREGWPPDEKGHWSLVLLDVRFDQKTARPEDERFGFTILQALRDEFGKDLPIVMLTGEGDETQRPAQDHQADGFLPKSQGSTDGRRFAQDFERRFLENGLFPDDRADGQRMIGQSLPFLRFLRKARTYAVNESEPLIIGETGVGKTEIARFIHDQSERRKGAFVKHTAKMLNEELMKSTIFGEWKGSHSTSSHNQAGEIEKAHGGTFFLDEVALMTPGVQGLFLETRDKKPHRGKYLRLVDRNGTFPSNARKPEVDAALASINGVPWPSDKDIQVVGVDVMLLSATNENLRDPEVRNRLGFRNDLFQSFKSFMEIPPLNERRADIPLLFDFFVQRACDEDIEIDAGVMDFLSKADWSESNVRGLEGAAEHAVACLSGFSRIPMDYLPGELLGAPSTTVSLAVSSDSGSKAGTPSEDPISAASPDAGGQGERGEYGRLYASFLAERLKSLAAALEETRKEDSGTGEPGDYSPTNAVRRMLGVSKLVKKGETAEAKRIIKEILKDVSEPKRVYREAIPDGTWQRLGELIDSSEALTSMKDL